MANYNNIKIQRIFCSHHSQNCWAYLQGVGWRKVGSQSKDGTSNVHVALVAARAHNINARVTTDSSDDRIEIVYV